MIKKVVSKMFCKKCGAEIVEGAKYCRKCGSSLEMKQESPMNNKKVKVYIVGGIIFIALIMAVVFSLKGKKAKEYKDNMVVAQKYIEELDYEQAKDFYLQAINIAPKELEPYVRLAQIYVEEGNIENAKKILDLAVSESAKGAREIEGEFEKIKVKLEELSNMVSYQWVVEPMIEADDIYYIKYDSENMEDPTNIEKRQVLEPYAVLRRDETLGLIDMNGNMVLDAKYKDMQQYWGSYLLESIESEYNASLQMEWNLYSWDERYGLQMADGFGGPGKETFYFKDGLHYGNEENGIYDIDIPNDAIPVLITDEVYKGYDSTGLWMYEWMDRQPRKYGICYQGELVTDSVYDECGSESEGLLAVCKDGKWGYVNQNGEEVIPVEYDSSWKWYNVENDIGNSKYDEFCYAASSGYVVLCKDEKWELRDVNGKIAIPAGKFEAIRPVYQGKCWVKQNGKWGVIELF